MLNKKKFLIISVLAIFIVAMSLSTVSASKTKSVTFKIDKYFKYKKLKNGDEIKYSYEIRDGMQWGDKGVTIAAFKDGLNNPKHTKLKKATIWFKKTSKNKGKKKIKKSSSNTSYYFSNTIHINLVNGYKPYKLKVWYKNK